MELISLSTVRPRARSVELGVAQLLDLDQTNQLFELGDQENVFRIQVWVPSAYGCIRSISDAHGLLNPECPARGGEGS